nr:hypothetical protein Iba_chr14aCG13400 [Ipomoea batatas]
MDRESYSRDWMSLGSLRNFQDGRKEGGQAKHGEDEDILSQEDGEARLGLGYSNGTSLRGGAFPGRLGSITRVFVVAWPRSLNRVSSESGEVREECGGDKTGNQVSPSDIAESIDVDPRCLAHLKGP